MKRIAAAAFAAALVAQILGPFAFAVDGNQGMCDYAAIDCTTGQVFDSQDPPNNLVVGTGTATESAQLTGHGTATLTSVVTRPMLTDYVTSTDPRLTDARASTNTLYAGTTNVTFSTGTGTVTSSNVAVSLNPKINVFDPGYVAVVANDSPGPLISKMYAGQGLSMALEGSAPAQWMRISQTVPRLADCKYVVAPQLQQELSWNLISAGTWECNSNGALVGTTYIESDITPVVGDRVCFMATSNEGPISPGRASNGVYTLTSIGSPSTKARVVRVADLDEAAEFVDGFEVFIQQGLTYGGTVAKFKAAGAITLDITPLHFLYRYRLTPSIGALAAGNILKWGDGNALVPSQLTDDGAHIGIPNTSTRANISISSTDTSASGLSGIELAKIYQGNAINQDGIRDLSYINPTNPVQDPAYCSFDTSISVNGDSRDYNHVAAYQNRAELQARNIGYHVGYDDWPNFSGSGTLSNRYGLHIRAVRGTGAITNNYGILVDDQTRGTNNYAIYTGAGAVRFGGNMTAADITAGNVNLTGVIAAANISATPGYNYIPKGDAGGTLDSWVTYPRLYQSCYSSDHTIYAADAEWSPASIAISTAGHPLKITYSISGNNAIGGTNLSIYVKNGSGTVIADSGTLTTVPDQAWATISASVKVTSTETTYYLYMDVTVADRAFSILRSTYPSYSKACLTIEEFRS